MSNFHDPNPRQQQILTSPSDMATYRDESAPERTGQGLMFSPDATALPEKQKQDSTWSDTSSGKQKQGVAWSSNTESGMTWSDKQGSGVSTASSFDKQSGTTSVPVKQDNTSNTSASPQGNTFPSNTSNTSITSNTSSEKQMSDSADAQIKSLSSSDSNAQTFRNSVKAVRDWAEDARAPFPLYALYMAKYAHVQYYVVDVATCATTYYQAMKAQSGTAFYESNKAITFTDVGFHGGATVKDVKKAAVAQNFNEAALRNAAKRALNEAIDYPTFMKEIASAGCEQFEVNFEKSAVMYSGHGSSFTEKIPACDETSLSKANSEFAERIINTRKFALDNKLSFTQLLHKFKRDGDVRKYHVDTRTGSTMYFSSKGHGIWSGDDIAYARLGGYEAKINDPSLLALRFDEDAVKRTLRDADSGQGSFDGFLKSLVQAGVEFYDVELEDPNNLRVVYTGFGQSHTEPIIMSKEHSS